MNSQRRFIEAAQRDARAGHDSVDDRIIAELGPRPELNPVGNAEHANFVAALDPVRTEELTEDLQKAEDTLAEHGSPLLYDLGLGCVSAIEMLGAILITRTLGLPPVERIPLGLALGTAFIGITAVVARHTSKTETAWSTTISEEEPRAARGRSRWTLLVVFAYAVLVAAITTVRLANADDDDSSPYQVAASSALLAATALGPAWLAEYLIRRRRPAAAALKRVRMLRSRLRQAERARARAQAAVERIARAGVEWDAAAARYRAAYRTEHRLASADSPARSAGALPPARLFTPTPIDGDDDETAS